MAAMPLIEAKHLVALTSPVTRRWREKHGWQLRSDWATTGTLYPKDTLRATVEHYVHPDYETHVAPEVLELMTSIRRRPAGVTTHVHGAKGQLNIRLNLTLDDGTLAPSDPAKGVLCGGVVLDGAGRLGPIGRGWRPLPGPAHARG